MGMRGGRERDLVRAVLDLLRLRGVPAWRANAGAVKAGKRLIRLAPAGCPDVIGLLPPAGRFLGVELKRPGGRVRPAQKAFLAALAAGGGLALVVRDLAEVDAALAEAGVG